MHQIKLQFKSGLDFDQAARVLKRIVDDVATIEDYKAFQKICFKGSAIMHAKRDSRYGETPESVRRAESRKPNHTPIVGLDGSAYIVDSEKDLFFVLMKPLNGNTFQRVPKSTRASEAACLALAHHLAMS